MRFLWGVVGRGVIGISDCYEPTQRETWTVEFVGVKDHSGIVDRIKTWENSHGELEVKLFDESKFLWHFSEDDTVTKIERGRFYCPVYRKTTNGESKRKSNHLFFILIEQDEDGDSVFVEIGPRGFVNRAYQPTARLQSDVESGDLLPMWQVSSSVGRPEDTIRMLKRLTQP